MLFINRVKCRELKVNLSVKGSLYQYNILRFWWRIFLSVYPRGLFGPSQNFFVPTALKHELGTLSTTQQERDKSSIPFHYA
jgi:hypothetical protein